MKRMIVAALAGTLALALAAAEPSKPAQPAANGAKAATATARHRHCAKASRQTQAQKPALEAPAKAAPGR